MLKSQNRFRKVHSVLYKCMILASPSEDLLCIKPRFPPCRSDGQELWLEKLSIKDNKYNIAPVCLRIVKR